jgi:hypothetical protein
MSTRPRLAKNRTPIRTLQFRRAPCPPSLMYIRHSDQCGKRRPLCRDRDVGDFPMFGTGGELAAEVERSVLACQFLEVT